MRILNTMDVKIKKTDKLAVIPAYASIGASGLDLSAIDLIIINPGERTLLRTGISIELPQGYGALVMGRSGNTIKRGLFVALGLIDSDYRGEIGVMAFNATDKKMIIQQGDRIGQLVIIPTPQILLKETSELSDTERGNGGFGSTGI